MYKWSQITITTIKRWCLSDSNWSTTHHLTMQILCTDSGTTNSTEKMSWYHDKQCSVFIIIKHADTHIVSWDRKCFSLGVGFLFFYFFCRWSESLCMHTCSVSLLFHSVSSHTYIKKVTVYQICIFWPAWKQTLWFLHFILLTDYLTVNLRARLMLKNNTINKTILKMYRNLWIMLLCNTLL